MKPNGNQRVGMVILAAGGSTRLGEPKQLLEYRGKTLLRRTVETALAVPDSAVFLVLGAFAETIRRETADLAVTVVENRDWPRGMGSSVRAGLNALLAAHPETELVIFMLCDQPFLSPETLQELIKVHRQTGYPVVACEYGNVVGVPALFHRSLFPELLAMDGTGGARQIIERHRNETAVIPFAEGGIDIDTRRDYERLIAE